MDIARLAGLNPAGVICEVMNDDGTMARLPDLVAFAQRHALKLGTIADLIALSPPHRAPGAPGAGRRAAPPRRGRLEAQPSMPTRSTMPSTWSLSKGDLAAALAGARAHAPGRSHERLRRRRVVAVAARRDAHDRRRGPRRPRAAARPAADRAASVSPAARQPAAPARRCATTASARRSSSISACATWCCSPTPSRVVVGLEGYGLNIVDQRPMDGILPMSTADAPLPGTSKRRQARRRACSWCRRPTTGTWWRACPTRAARILREAGAPGRARRRRRAGAAAGDPHRAAGTSRSTATSRSAASSAARLTTTTTSAARRWTG